MYEREEGGREEVRRGGRDREERRKRRERKGGGTGEEEVRKREEEWERRRMSLNSAVLWFWCIDPDPCGPSPPVFDILALSPPAPSPAEVTNTRTVPQELVRRN